jgi:hypothetical protein
MNNNDKKITLALLPLGLLVIAATTTTINNAYAQSNTVVLGSTFSPMNDETLQYLKEYLIATIQNNLTEPASVIIDGQYGTMSIMDFGQKETDSIDDMLFNTGPGFSEANGYRFEDNRLFAANGTQLLPRE